MQAKETRSSEMNHENLNTNSAPSMKLQEHKEIAEGLFALHLDLPNEKVNKLSPTVVMELDQVLESIKTRKDIKVLVVVSEKPGIFIAGADIQVIKTVHSKEDGRKLAAEGQAVLEKLERMPFPVVAAIHGASMGGGTELAMCCKYIVVSDSQTTKIGLPEVNLGILPGFGGTVRLPERIGLQTSLDFILTGKTMDGQKALKLGFADALLPEHDFKTRVLQWAAAFAKGQKPVIMKRRLSFGEEFGKFLLEGNPAGRALMFSQAKKMVMSRTHGHYPAPIKILEVLAESAGRSKKDALAIENKAFGELVITDVSKRLIDLFFATEKVKKQTGVVGAKLEEKDKVKAVGLLGAGVMGGGIAQVIANKNIPIRMKDIDYKGLGIGMAQAARVFKDLVKKRKLTPRQAEQRLELISSTTDYSGFSKADLVIEAVLENMDVKKKVLKEAEEVLKPDAIFATNTSSLLVTELATASKHPENVVGMHFFNPVPKMPLVEVIRAEKSSDRAILATFELAKRMGKTPIVVKDGAGFLVNRLLLPYLNEASFLISEGAPIPELDKEVLNFGMPMGPATLLDEVGLDVGTKVSKILYEAFGMRAEPCKRNEKMVEAKLYGRKSGKGFYLYEASGKRGELNPDVYKILGVTPVQPTREQRANWIPRMMFMMINEAALCLQEGIVQEPQDVDLGMIMGTGFPPFRGGLLRYADAVGLPNIVKKLEEFTKVVGPRFTPSEPLVRLASAGKGFYSA